jgi:hypothetical protein
MRKYLSYASFLALILAVSPVYAAGYVSIADPTNPSYVAGVDSSGNLKTTGSVGTVTTVTTITNPVGVKGADGSTISSTANPFPTEPASADPCQTTAGTPTPISITTATTTRIVAPTSAKKTYICYLFVTSAAADNVGIVEGTGGTCGSGTAGVIGGTTAANGPNFPANGGMSLGGGGFFIAATAGTNVDLCLITSAATPLAGVIKWVQAP